MIVYYHITSDRSKDAVAFGMKLSEFGDTSIKTGNDLKNVIVAYLCPSDDKKRYNLQRYTCLCIEIPGEKAYIIEGAYLEMGNSDAVNQSICAAKDYNVGTYRKPLVLITTTVFSENIKILDKYMDIPILIQNSEELYLKNALTDMENSDPRYYEKALAGYISMTSDAKKLSEKGEYTVYSLRDKKYIVKKSGN